ncbi:MAG: ATP-binding protein [Gammaproteobacteria bacterium]|nr:ATP-binding protein [Gammaproteobacteria bacterium]MDH3406927.1 ATP-binding protein [Gammaproteobacteria bacterium]MDH3562567.1 ATP-binding protein [Gammaproteobacteria bacterium]MDH5486923.1 ATP-binding protein [Gammaproteobacteria bacterium]
MDITTTDVTFHLDETLGHNERELIRDKLLSQNGILSAATNDKTPHLMIVVYDPDMTAPETILELLNHDGVHAERLG